MCPVCWLAGSLDFSLALIFPCSFDCMQPYLCCLIFERRHTVILLRLSWQIQTAFISFQKIVASGRPRSGFLLWGGSYSRCLVIGYLLLPVGFCVGIIIAFRKISSWVQHLSSSAERVIKAPVPASAVVATTRLASNLAFTIN